MKNSTQLSNIFTVIIISCITAMSIIFSLYMENFMILIMIVLIYISLMQAVYLYNFPTKIQMQDKWVLMQSGAYQGYIYVPTYASSYSPYNTAVGNTTPYASGSVVSAKRLSQIIKMNQKYLNKYANTTVNQSYYGKIKL